ncbi:c-type cytochrome [Aestuariivita sp.]|jgi:cytochrome c|uniref:c-type cytochrome n=1 Tax=Aestuariivita sp. TaxID=1872407 RepID=UPI00216B882B|nr:c-type cytochrome [Aestuariivita sp.]MCE8008456.1 c-type cytochrome [Aestuariivita sp.]
MSAMIRGLALSVTVALIAATAVAQDLRGHGGPVRALAMQGVTIYSGSFDTRAIVWEGTVARQVTRAHAGAVTAVLPLPDGRFASGGQDGHVAIWGAGVNPLSFEKWHDLPVADFAPWRGGLASASWDGQIALWDGTSERRYLDGHDGQITGLVAFGDGLASVGADLRLRLWRADGTPGPVVDLAAPPADLATNGQALFIAGADGFLRRVVPGAPTTEVELTTRPLLGIAADHDLIAVSDLTGQIWLLDPETLEIRANFSTGQGAVWALVLSGDEVLTGGNDGWIRRWTVDGTALGSGAGLPHPTLNNPRGAEVFRACAVCHSLTPDDEQRAGPTLYRVFGRKIGTAEGFDYSDALRGMDIVWTPETVAELFEFGPTAYTPGSRMPEQRIPSASDRQALVDFLQRAAR